MQEPRRLPRRKTSTASKNIEFQILAQVDLGNRFLLICSMSTAILPKQLRYEYLSPLDIRFTQETISPILRNGRPLIDIVRQIACSSIRNGDVPMPVLRVVKHSGSFFSLDNRSLAVFRILEMLGIAKVVKTAIVPKDAKQWKRKFNTTCDGEVAHIRVYVTAGGLYPSSARSE